MQRFNKHDFYRANIIFLLNFLVEYQLKYQHDYNKGKMTNLDKPF